MPLTKTCISSEVLKQKLAFVEDNYQNLNEIAEQSAAIKFFHLCKSKDKHSPLEQRIQLSKKLEEFSNIFRQKKTIQNIKSSSVSAPPLVKETQSPGKKIAR